MALIPKLIKPKKEEKEKKELKNVCRRCRKATDFSFFCLSCMKLPSAQISPAMDLVKKDGFKVRKENERTVEVIVPNAKNGLPMCTSCGRELSATLDFYSGKDKRKATQCIKCRKDN